jgi:hypothetical protein
MPEWCKVELVFRLNSGITCCRTVDTARIDLEASSAGTVIIDPLAIVRESLQLQTLLAAD